jgi:hypothetical protein
MLFFVSWSQSEHNSLTQGNIVIGASGNAVPRVLGSTTPPPETELGEMHSDFTFSND